MKRSPVVASAQQVAEYVRQNPSVHEKGKSMKTQKHKCRFLVLGLVILPALSLAAGATETLAVAGIS